MKKIDWMEWWNAAEYTMASLSDLKDDQSEHLDCTWRLGEEWISVHRGRAHQSREFLKKIKEFAKEMQEENYVLITEEEYNNLDRDSMYYHLGIEKWND